MDELTALPASFAAGTTVVYRRCSSDYPASDGWTLALHLRGVSALDVTATADGDDYVLTLKASATAALTPGDYRWDELVTLGEDDDREVHSLGFGTVTVTRDLAAAAAGDAQARDEAELAAIRALLDGRLPADVEAYQIDGVALTRVPIEQLWARERELMRRIARRRRGSGAFAGVVRARSTRTGSR